MAFQSDELSQKIRQKGRRMTKQRTVILEELRKVTSHPRTEEIYHLVKKRLPNISLGTVYRNLGLFRDLGLITELDYGKNFSRYDGNPRNHYHFACLRCGQVFDFAGEILAELDEKVAKKMEFTVSHHRLEFYGLCKDCQKGGEQVGSNSKSERSKQLD